MTANEVVTMRVREQMARHDLDQRATAQRTGINESVLSRKLRMKQPWTIEDLDRLADGLEIPVPWLVMVSSVTHSYRMMGESITSRYSTLVTLASLATRRYDQRSAWGLAA